MKLINFFIKNSKNSIGKIYKVQELNLVKRIFFMFLICFLKINKDILQNIIKLIVNTTK
jgi:hypothetical protein